jgi:hypothetical protein
LLNGESPSAPPKPPPLTQNNNNNVLDNNKLENIVTKLTRKHMGVNARESYQCQVCSKWFAVPPIKHLRGHLVAFKDEHRSYIGLVNNNGYACLSCFHIANSPQDITDHMANIHHVLSNNVSSNDVGGGGGHRSPEIQEVTPVVAAYSPPPRVNTSNLVGDPKGVELDNAGRVKSGKVRKQCELCGQWSNIKWFFKHMSEMHNALFCRCCREYLPIHEQEEHRRFHAEPPYMGQKIRIEKGLPVIIDRKERASLTPIGSLASWGGSSGGMVVKAVDDGTSHLISRKRKGGTNNGNTSSQAKVANNSLVCKDTLMPKETCPVCGIQITYKNLARHIKLRHKIKYKFCHKCRKFVPNDTYEDHKVQCTVSEIGAEEHLSNQGVDQQDSVDASDYLDMDGASALVINTDDNEDTCNEDEDGKKSNTSKNKLESLLGKEFKHPRRKCGICGYTVSYSNFKRHLKNAHPSISQEEIDNEPIKYLGHQMDDDIEVDEDMDINAEDYVECTLCGDHIMKNYLERHMKMNHSSETAAAAAEAEVEVKEVKMRDCPVCLVNIRAESVVKHCKIKHKVTYKWCRPCEKYVLKKQYRTHILSSDHKEHVAEGEKHSSHEEEDEDDADDDIIKEETV